MRGTNRSRALIVSGGIVLLALTVIVGMTWALFTDTRTVKHHLRAGDLTVSLTRTNLQKTTLNEKGYLVVNDPITVREDFTDSTDKNVFDIKTDNDGNVIEKIIPGSSFSATMEIANRSDVAFGYWVEIVCVDKSKGEDLAKQVMITATGADGSVSVADGLNLGNENNFLGVLEVGEQLESFTVTVTFDDKGYTFENGVLTSKNDAAQDQEILFDLVVYAIQVKTPQS